MWRTALLAVLLFVSGCGGAKLHPDELPGSISSNYPSLEMYACGKVFHGMGECQIEPGQALSKVNIWVQSYYRGTIQIDSPDCEYTNTLSYEGWQWVPVTLPGAAYRNCTIGITLAPEYPPQHKQNIVVESFRGYLRLRYLEKGTLWKGFHSRIKAGSFAKIAIPSKEAKQVFIEGCGLTTSPFVELNDGNLVLDLKTLGFDSTKVRRCTIEGIVPGPTPEEDLFFTWPIAVYAENYLPLPKPAITYGKNTITVVSDKNTSVVSLDNMNKIDRSAKFKFDPNQSHILRTLTVKGRSALGVWDPAVKKWNWLSDNE